ncbi:MAG TPA: WD40 repeat domain-containing protein, partial [Fimbriimonadaceae bacterium]|nr:WD40 repeat domain-containing protein [Fimbriimonadaceae bacterium]
GNPPSPYGCRDQLLLMSMKAGRIRRFATRGEWMDVMWNPNGGDLLAVETSAEPIPDWMGNDTLWLLGSGNARRKVVALDEPSYHCGFSGSGNAILYTTTDHDDAVWIWKPGFRKPRKLFDEAGAHFSWFAVSPDDRIIAVLVGEGDAANIQFRRFRDGTIMGSAHYGPEVAYTSIVSMVWSSDSRCLCCTEGSGAVAKVWVYTADAKLAVSRIALPNAVVTGWIPSRKTFVLSSGDGFFVSLWLLSVETKKLSLLFRHPNMVEAVHVP